MDKRAGAGGGRTLESSSTRASRADQFRSRRALTQYPMPSAVRSSRRQSSRTSFRAQEDERFCIRTQCTAYFRFTACARMRRLAAMRIFEPHAHMYARTTADYEAMARAGVEYL